MLMGSISPLQIPRVLVHCFFEGIQSETQLGFHPENIVRFWPMFGAIR